MKSVTKHHYLARLVAVVLGIATLCASAGARAQQQAPHDDATMTQASSVAGVRNVPARGPSTLQTDYALGTGDEIRISVFNEPDLTLQQRIGADGQVAVPLVGDLNVVGMSPASVAQTVQAKLIDGGFLRRPQVGVSVVTYRPFFVTGEVNNAGAFPYAPNLTLSSAIATAGGFSRRAARGQVYVKREGELEEHAYAANAAIALRPGDTVRVAQSVLAVLGDLPLGLIPH